MGKLEPKSAIPSLLKRKILPFSVSTSLTATLEIKTRSRKRRRRYLMTQRQTKSKKQAKKCSTFKSTSKSSCKKMKKSLRDTVMKRLSSTIKYRRWKNNRNFSISNLHQATEVVREIMTDHSNKEGMARETLTSTISI